MTGELNKTIGKRVRATREARGYTIRQLAEYVDLSQPQITRLETAQQGFRIDVLERIAKALDIPPYVFLLPEDKLLKASTLGERIIKTGRQA